MNSSIQPAISNQQTVNIAAGCAIVFILTLVGGYLISNLNLLTAGSPSPDTGPVLAQNSSGQPSGADLSDDQKYARAQSALEGWSGDDATYQQAITDLSSSTVTGKTKAAFQMLLRKWNRRKNEHDHQVAVDLRRQEGTEWTADESEAPMGRGTRETVTIQSDNEFELDSPYSGQQRATLILRKDPKYGHDVILRIERGQIVTGVEGTSIRVRFGNDPEQTFDASPSADYDSSVMFIRGYDRFLRGIKHSHMVSIEVPLYVAGEKVMTFKWDKFPW